MFRNDISINQLRNFVVVAEELHFHRAAQRLNLSQPPLSRSIRSLEFALGAQLFQRTTRRVALTPAGDKFLSEARSVLQAMQKARERTQIVATGRTGVFVLGFIEPVANDFLPRLLTAVRRESPHLKLSFVHLNALDQIEALRAGEIDAGILRQPTDLTGLQSRTIYSEELVLALPESHRFAYSGTINLKLLNDPFIVYSAERGHSLYNALRRACALAGVVPRISHEACSTALLMSLVAAGEGIALVSGEAARIPRPGVRFAHITPDPPYVPISIVWRREDATPALACVVRHAERAGPELPRSAHLAG